MDKIDITPTWAQHLNTCLLIMESATAEGRKAAIEELRNMARVADMTVTRDKAIQALNRLDTQSTKPPYVVQTLASGQFCLKPIPGQIVAVIEDLPNAEEIALNIATAVQFHTDALDVARAVFAMAASINNITRGDHNDPAIEAKVELIEGIEGVWGVSDWCHALALDFVQLYRGRQWETDEDHRLACCEVMRRSATREAGK